MSVDLNLGDTREILAECRCQGLTRQQAAYVLATAYWESARTMKPVREAFWVHDAENWRKKNLRYYPWYGRGYVQLTWNSNYGKISDLLHKDLTSDPDVVMEPAVATEILVRGCAEGWFTPHKLSDFISDRECNYVGARRIINGADKAQAIAEIAREYEEDLAAEGYAGKRAPLANDRRDGTPPRKSVAQSTTVQAIGVAGLASVGQALTVIKGLVGQVSETIGVSPNVALALITIGALAWIFRERWMRWIEGDR